MGDDFCTVEGSAAVWSASCPVERTTGCSCRAHPNRNKVIPLDAWMRDKRFEGVLVTLDDVNEEPFDTDLHNRNATKLSEVWWKLARVGGVKLKVWSDWIAEVLNLDWEPCWLPLEVVRGPVDESSLTEVKEAWSRLPVNAQKERVGLLLSSFGGIQPSALIGMSASYNPAYRFAVKQYLAYAEVDAMPFVRCNFVSSWEHCSKVSTNRTSVLMVYKARLQEINNQLASSRPDNQKEILKVWQSHIQSQLQQMEPTQPVSKAPRLQNDTTSPSQNKTNESENKSDALAAPSSSAVISSQPVFYKNPTTAPAPMTGGNSLPIGSPSLARAKKSNQRANSRNNNHQHRQSPMAHMQATSYMGPTQAAAAAQFAAAMAHPSAHTAALSQYQAMLNQKAAGLQPHLLGLMSSAAAAAAHGSPPQPPNYQGGALSAGTLAMQSSLIPQPPPQGILSSQYQMANMQNETPHPSSVRDMKFLQRTRKKGSISKKNTTPVQKKPHMVCKAVQTIPKLSGTHTVNKAIQTLGGNNLKSLNKSPSGKGDRHNREAVNLTSQIPQTLSQIGEVSVEGGYQTETLASTEIQTENLASTEMCENDVPQTMYVEAPFTNDTPVIETATTADDATTNALSIFLAGIANLQSNVIANAITVSSIQNEALPSTELGVNSDPPTAEVGVTQDTSPEVGGLQDPSTEDGVPPDPSTEVDVVPAPSIEVGAVSAPSTQLGVGSDPSREVGVASDPSKEGSILPEGSPGVGVASVSPSEIGVAPDLSTGFSAGQVPPAVVVVAEVVGLTNLETQPSAGPE